ncbi:MAG: hypothetical protein M3N68_06565 [Actinomycetota bacterium]|nr:hypothetical protein [Actinomycetota bacterium]
MTQAVSSRRLVTVRRVVISLLLALSAAGMYVAFTLHEESPEAFRPRAIQVVFPEPGSLEVRQTTIFYELGSDYDGTLRVGGVEIPLDQLDVIEGLNRISFTPGKGKEIEALEPGAQRVTAVFWPRSEGRSAALTYSWRFNVH